jgi:hypothetical protein
VKRRFAQQLLQDLQPREASLISMAPAHAKKQALVSTCSDPLQQAGVLKLVISFLGREGVFVQTVSKHWQSLYNAMILQRASSRSSVYSSSHTSYEAVFASAARLFLAFAYGLRLADVQRYARRHADIDTLRAAFKLGLPRSEEVASGAAESADVGKLIWLRTKQHCHFPHNITVIAAAAGNVQVLQWLKQRRFALNKSTSSAAASRPHNISVLQYLRETGCEWHSNCCGKAGATADVLQLQWLHNHGAPLAIHSSYEAAVGGSVQVFEFLQQQGITFDRHTMQRAAYYGHLQLCQ